MKDVIVSALPAVLAAIAGYYAGRRKRTSLTAEVIRLVQNEKKK